MEEKLLNYYLALKGPEAGEWNSSPDNLYAECMTRDYVRKEFVVKDGMQVCNIGIGTGDWDDYLGYWLKDKGQLTSIDIDADICELFAYRQQREEHSNPSQVLNRSIFDADLPQGAFDLVTLIGSTISEAGEFERCLDACLGLLKPGGSLMFMTNLKRSPVSRLEHYAEDRGVIMEQLERYEAFNRYPFHISTLRRGPVR
jgi:SAM-dependent methyltransferase